MLYELIANSVRVLETIERDYDSRVNPRVDFSFIADEPETETDIICNPEMVGTRLIDGFNMLGYSNE